MSIIEIELAKNPLRYKPNKLPKILRVQFGAPTKKHYKAWE